MGVEPGSGDDHGVPAGSGPSDDAPRTAPTTASSTTRGDTPEVDASPGPKGLRARWRGMSRRMRVLAVAALVFVLAIGPALAWVAFDRAPEAAVFDPSAPVAVVGTTTEGSMFFTLATAALGESVRTETTESMTWNPVTPGGERIALGDASGPPVPLAEGGVGSEDLTDLRLRFTEVSVVTDGGLKDLVMGHDTLWLKVPGDPGRPGDALLVVFDTTESIVESDGLFTFRPVVAEASWLRGGVDAYDPAADVEDAGYEKDRSGMDGGPDGATDDGETPATSAPEQTSFTAEEATDGGAADDGAAPEDGAPTGDGDDGGADDDRSRVTLYARDAVLKVKHLNVTFERVAFAIGSEGSSLYTVYEGARTVDLVAYRDAEARALIGDFQVPPGRFGSLHIQFAPRADGHVAGDQERMSVPQPHLTIEVPFDAHGGAHLDLLVDFDVDRSLVLGADGWEFRPVVGQYQDSAEDADGDGVADAQDPDDDNDGIPDNLDPDRDGDGEPESKPPQYREGGSSLPSIGHSNKARVEGATGRDWQQSQMTLEKAVTGGRSAPLETRVGTTVDRGGSTTERTSGTTDTTGTVDDTTSDTTGTVTDTTSETTDTTTETVDDTTSETTDTVTDTTSDTTDTVTDTVSGDPLV